MTRGPVVSSVKESSGVGPEVSGPTVCRTRTRTDPAVGAYFEVHAPPASEYSTVPPATIPAMVSAGSLVMPSSWRDPVSCARAIDGTVASLTFVTLIVNDFSVVKPPASLERTRIVYELLVS